MNAIQLSSRLAKTACAAALLAASLGACAATVAPQDPFTVKLIGFNDFHGNLQSPGTFGQNTLVPSARALLKANTSA